MYLTLKNEYQNYIITLNIFDFQQKYKVIKIRVISETD